MRTYAFTLFETAIGPCALAWCERGIAGVQLPELDAAATRQRMLERFPDAREAMPPAVIVEVRDAIVALLHGEKPDLSSVALDMEAVPTFHRRVYEAARAIMPGETLTEGAARAVGQALGRNPFPIIVPCHRVLAASGKLGGFSAHGGIETKRKLLEIEGVSPGTPSLFESAPSLRRRRTEVGRRGDGLPRAHPSR
jgi:methylated-DNA-[protein]-cysteine S-methyltransferase